MLRRVFQLADHIIVNRILTPKTAIPLRQKPQSNKNLVQDEEKSQEMLDQLIKAPSNIMPEFRSRLPRINQRSLFTIGLLQRDAAVNPNNIFLSQDFENLAEIGNIQLSSEFHLQLMIKSLTKNNLKKSVIANFKEFQEQLRNFHHLADYCRCVELDKYVSQAVGPKDFRNDPEFLGKLLQAYIACISLTDEQKGFGIDQASMICQEVMKGLGIVKAIPIQINGVCIETDMKVSEAKDYIIIIGNEWLKKVKTLLDYELCELTICSETKPIVVKCRHWTVPPEVVKQQQSNNDDNSDDSDDSEDKEEEDKEEEDKEEKDKEEEDKIQISIYNL
ncbi:hypothetical protein G9A89_002221 [Geosiphon pyriformis]|nr:hypothetical protein G9A89_002221 [Geosiphon pyriformis]